MTITSRQHRREISLADVDAASHRRSGNAVSFLVQICLVSVAYLAYLSARLVVEGDRVTAIRNARRVVQFERDAGFYVEQPVQRWVLNSRFLSDAFAIVYLYGFVPFVAAGLVLLFWRRPRYYLLLRNSLAVSALLAVLCVWLFPAMPPRMLGGDGLVDLLAVQQRPHPIVNPYGAVPSLHVGWSVLTSVVLYMAYRRAAWRWLVFLPAVIMLAAVVVTGNHLIFDALIGMMVTLIPLAVLTNHGRFRAWWTEWMTVKPGSDGVLASLRRDRWAAIDVTALTALALYLFIRQSFDSGFTDYWGYMLAQILVTIALVIWITHRFGPERGLYPITHGIIILVTYLDTLGTAAHFYSHFSFYDKITHTGGGAVLAAAMFDLLLSLRERGALGWSVRRVACIAVIVSISLGATWEIYEYAGDMIFNTGRHAGRVDTTYDLISDSTGALIAVLVLVVTNLRGGDLVRSRNLNDPTRVIER